MKALGNDVRDERCGLLAPICFRLRCRIRYCCDKNGTRRVGWFFLLLVASLTSSIAAQSSGVGEMRETSMIDQHDKLKELDTLYEVIRFQEERMHILGPWPFLQDRENEERISIDCAGYWEHLRGLAGKQNRRSVRDGHREFFGYLHGKIGASPPIEWRYYLQKGELGDIEGRQNAKSMLVEATEEFFIASGSIKFNGGSFTNRGYVEFYPAHAPGPAWKCDLLVMRPVPDGVGLSGQTNGTVWADFTCVGNDGPIVCWGIDNCGYCYAYVFDRLTGRVRDYLFLPVK